MWRIGNQSLCNISYRLSLHGMQHQQQSTLVCAGVRKRKRERARGERETEPKIKKSTVCEE